MAIQDELKRPKSKSYQKDDFGNKVENKNFKQKWIPQKNDTMGEKLGKIISIAALIILIASLSVLIYYFIESKSANDDYNKIKNAYDNAMTSTSDSDIDSSIADNSPLPLLPFAEELLKQNPDTVGFINMPNTNVKYPVVLRKGEEEGNLYYLNHKFDGAKNNAGAVFADYRTTIEDRSQSDNIVLYSHNEKDNTMFGDLDLYKKMNTGYTTKADIEYYKTNTVFDFNTNYQTGKYKIFAMFVTTTLKETDPSYEVFDYQNYIDFDEQRYNDFIKKINERNMIKTDIDLEYGDKFVTLSTCSSEITDSRFVIIGRKIRPGESEAVDIEKASLNENYMEPNWQAIFKNYAATLKTTVASEDTTQIDNNSQITDFTDYSEATTIEEVQTSDSQDTLSPETNIPIEETEPFVVVIDGMEDIE